MKFSSCIKITNVINQNKPKFLKLCILSGIVSDVDQIVSSIFCLQKQDIVLSYSPDCFKRHCCSNKIREIAQDIVHKTV